MLRAIRYTLQLAAGVLCCTLSASAATDVQLVPPAWVSDSTYEFGIYDRSGERTASAYYRILLEETNERPAYRFKYMGKNDKMSESSECWVHRETLLPLRSTRKIVSGAKVFYQDVAYGDKVIVLRKRYGDEPVKQTELPSNGRFFDYEELMWLIPQVATGGAPVRVELFDTLTEMPTTILITDAGEETLVVKDQSYPARLLTFDVSMVPYRFYIVQQNGIGVPGRVEMGDTTFVNLRLDPKKVTGPKAVVAAPAATPEAVEEEEGEARPEPERGENPFGPPTGNSRF
jgi:hypothetical protein